MSLEKGILGFLNMKSLSGYDIKKLYDMSASYFWPANQSQIELKDSQKTAPLDKKVYSITDKGRAVYLNAAAENSVEDFISRDVFLMQLFFSGALSEGEQLELIETQLENIKALELRLLENYNKNLSKFLYTTGLEEKDRRLQSAVFAYRWGLIKCREYAKLLEEIKSELK
jgi:DNA-binding PadR family transcriptional regulator